MAGEVYGISVGIVPEVLCTKGNALIEGYVVADDGGFTDDYAGPVVDGEVAADAGARMDVYAGYTVGIFSKHPGDDPRPEIEKDMGGAVIQHRGYCRVAIDDFPDTLYGRVVLGEGFDVGKDQVPDFRESLHEGLGRGRLCYRSKFRFNAGKGLCLGDIAVFGEDGVLDTCHHLLKMLYSLGD